MFDQALFVVTKTNVRNYYPPFSTFNEFPKTGADVAVAARGIQAVSVIVSSDDTDLIIELFSNNPTDL